MSDDFHHRALILELLKFVLFNDLALDFLDGYDSVLPAASVHDTIAAFRKFTIIAKLCERNLIVLDKRTSLVRNVIVASVLLVLYQSLLKLAFQVPWVGTGIF